MPLPFAIYLRWWSAFCNKHGWSSHVTFSSFTIFIPNWAFYTVFLTCLKITPPTPNRPPPPLLFYSLPSALSRSKFTELSDKQEFPHWYAEVQQIYKLTASLSIHCLADSSLEPSDLAPFSGFGHDLEEANFLFLDFGSSSCKMK